MNFQNSPHLLGPLGALVLAMKMKLLWLLTFMGLGTVGATGEIDFYTRISNLELAVMGGPSVNSPFTPTLLSGSTDVLPYPNQFVLVTSTGVDAMTLATPVATTDDFKKVRVISTTAHAHTITTAASKIVDGATAAGDTLTFTAYAGASCELMAYQGLWYVLNLLNVTLSEV